MRGERQRASEDTKQKSVKKRQMKKKTAESTLDERIDAHVHDKCIDG